MNGVLVNEWGVGDDEWGVGDGGWRMEDGRVRTGQECLGPCSLISFHSFTVSSFCGCVSHGELT